MVADELFCGVTNHVLFLKYNYKYRFFGHRHYLLHVFCSVQLGHFLTCFETDRLGRCVHRLLAYCSELLLWSGEGSCAPVFYFQICRCVQSIPCAICCGLAVGVPRSVGQVANASNSLSAYLCTAATVFQHGVGHLVADYIG